MATIRDVAAAAGVSPATVSLVLNERRGFYSAETARRVLAAAEKLNYTPSTLARSLRTGRSHSMAVVGEGPADPHAAPMLQAVHELALRFGYHVSVLPPTDPVEHQFTDRRFDVVLIARDVSTADAIGASIAGSHQIAIAAGSIFATPPSQVLAACWSDREGVGALVEHLAALGHRQVAYLAAQRSTGGKGGLFAAATSARGMTTTVLRAAQPGDDMALGAALAREALSLRPRPTALMGRTDAVALGALHAVREAGLRVPEDISVAGYYDFTFSSYLSPSLTTVYTPFKECAVAVLTEALEALGSDPVVPPQPRVMEFATELRVRGSTGPAPA